MVEAASPGTPGKLEADVGLRATREAPGWFVEEGEDDLPDRLVGELEGRGWALVASGQEGVWTGVKEGGRCSWLALSCIRVSDALCVVLQVNAPMG